MDSWLLDRNELVLTIVLLCQFDNSYGWKESNDAMYTTKGA